MRRPNGISSEGGRRWELPRLLGLGLKYSTSAFLAFSGRPRLQPAHRHLRQGNGVVTNGLTFSRIRSFFSRSLLDCLLFHGCGGRIFRGGIQGNLCRARQESEHIIKKTSGERDGLMVPVLAGSCPPGNVANTGWAVSLSSSSSPCFSFLCFFIFFVSFFLGFFYLRCRTL